MKTTWQGVILGRGTVIKYDGGSFNNVKFLCSVIKEIWSSVTGETLDIYRSIKLSLSIEKCETGGLDPSWQIISSVGRTSPPASEKNSVYTERVSSVPTQIKPGAEKLHIWTEIRLKGRQLKEQSGELCYVLTSLLKHVEVLRPMQERGPPWAVLWDHRSQQGPHTTTDEKPLPRPTSPLAAATARWVGCECGCPWPRYWSLSNSKLVSDLGHGHSPGRTCAFWLTTDTCFLSIQLPSQEEPETWVSRTARDTLRVSCARHTRQKEKRQHQTHFKVFSALKVLAVLISSGSSTPH